MNLSKTKEITDLFGIKYPIIQAGMVWVGGADLAAASSNAGILGLIGAGSMQTDILRQHLQKVKTKTDKPVGVNIPLLYKHCEAQIEVCLKEGVTIFFISAGSPKKYTSYLQDKGCVVIHVTSTPELAKKCELAGVDGIVAEGFEAGGHNGRDEITTMCLIPQVVDAVSIPVIAAGGISDGRGMMSALALGASGAQIGTRFVTSIESSAQENFKHAIVNAGPSDTMLSMKKLEPVRLLKNEFFKTVHEAEAHGASVEELREILGKGLAKQGMFDGDVTGGELEIGQVSGMIQSVDTVADIVDELIETYNSTLKSLVSL
jgi:enoyl-[acyl-carrier protein] reductase II